MRKFFFSTRAVLLFGLLLACFAVTYTAAEAQTATTSPQTTITTATDGSVTRNTSNSGPCAATPGSTNCKSFDVSKNPLLSGYTASSRAEFKLKDGSTCRYYDKKGGAVGAIIGAIGGVRTDYTGCLSPGGVFSFDGDTIIAGEAGAVPGSAAPTTGTDYQDSNGNTGTKVNSTAPGDTGGNCSLVNGNLGACLEGILFSLIKMIGFLFLSIATTFAGLAGLLLNWVVYITVFQFGNLIGNNPGLLAAWGVLRDIGNLILLFGFIFMGISTILSLPGNEFTARKALPGLIIFAILMNFSLFAAEAVIDTSNAIGTTLYRQAGQGMCPAGTDFAECATNYGISGSVFRVSGISAIFNFDGNKAKDVIQGNDIGAIVEIIGLTVFAAVAAFVFFAAVFLFVTRCVVLAFLMVISPIGFAGMAIPPLHEMASSWWSNLLKQSFFAPVYILLILVSLKFMEGVTIALNTASGGGDISNLAAAFSTSGASNVSMIINFILITGFMLGSLIMAQRFGAAGASGATKFAGAATFGAAGFVGRRTIGRAGATAAAGLRKTSFARSGFGKLVVGGLDATGKGSFDVRGTGAGALLTKQVGDVGKAQKGGYSGIVHEEEEKRKKYASSLKNSSQELEEKKNLDVDSTNARAAIRDAEASHRTELAGLEADLATQNAKNEAILAPQRTQIDDKRRDLADARAKGDTKRADALELSLNNDLRAYDVTKQQAEKNLEPFKQNIAQANERLKTFTVQQNARVAANEERKKTITKAPRAQYAESLHNSNFFDYAGGVGADANHHAKEFIEGELDKDDTRKLLDALTKANENASKPPPAAPAAGGGGAPAGDHH